MIEIRIDDLAFYRGDAIVRPVNADLGATTPLMRRLELAAGPRLTNHLHVQEPLPVGAAIVSGAGDLTVELMVHAVISSTEEPVSRDSVRRAMISALQRVEAWQIPTVAIPPFGLGAGNLDIDQSADVMLTVLASHIKHARFPVDVTVIAETAEEEQALIAAARRSGL